MKRYLFVRLAEPHSTNPTDTVDRITRLLQAAGARFDLLRPADDESARAWDLSIELHADDAKSQEPGRLHAGWSALHDLLAERAVVTKSWVFEHSGRTP